MSTRTPRPIVKRPMRVESAAIAGILYSLLAGASLLIVHRLPVAPSVDEWDEWIGDVGNRRSLGFALVSSSTAAVAFLWFVAVVRRRVGAREDRFFATVFLGSALVNVTLWLVGMSALTAPALAVDDGVPSMDSEAYGLAAGFGRAVLFVASPRISAVFVASTSTVFLRTRVVPNWLAYLGYAAALVMFVVPIIATPVGLGLPAFVLVSSVVILLVADVPRSEPMVEGDE